MFTDKRIAVVGNSIRHRLPGSKGSTSKTSAAHKQTAMLVPMAPMGGVNATVMGYFGANASGRTFDSIIPDQNEDNLINAYRDIYYYDSVAGSACDLTAHFPFSDWTLIGLGDQKRGQVYGEAMARLNIRSLLPEMSLSYLVDGDFIGTLIYDSVIKNFMDVLVHDRTQCQIFSSALYAIDPAIRLLSSPRLRQYVSNSRYAEGVLKSYPKKIIDTFLAGNVELDPLTTIHLSRRTLSDRGGVSYLKRVLPIYMLEKILYRGTLVEASKRLRATTHIQAGEPGEWEPTDAELQEILNRFQESEVDPLGAWVITRQGVSVTDIRQGGDFWKWTDNADTLTPLKLRALGISEAFLAGDSSYATAEAALSVFLENIESFRNFLTYKVFQSKLFPLIALANGFYKDTKEAKKPNSKHDLLFNLNNQKNLDIPQIQWAKDLTGADAANRMDMLDKLSEKGFPIPMKMWASAANIPIGAILNDLEEDQTIREQIKKYAPQSLNPNSDAEGGDDSNFDRDTGYPDNAFDEAASFNRSPIKRRSLADRKFEPTPVTRKSKSGNKVHSVYNERQVQQKHNEMIAKATAALDDPNYRAQVQRRVKARLGSIPDLGFVPRR